MVGPHRSGFVALVGRPNVGKSTILNCLLGQKLAATTHKPQTTRRKLLGIVNLPGAQLLLLDTPGHHRAEGPLNRFMVSQAEEAIAQADLIGFVIEARSDARITPGNDRLLEVLARAEKPIVLLVNKVDRVADKGQLLPLIDVYRSRLGDRLAAVVPMSATRGIGLADVMRDLAALLPEGPPLYLEDELTDESERGIVSELIREKVMLETRAELPYAVAVTIEAFEDRRPRLVRIAATIHVERPSQKGIVIGRRGERLKAIGIRARKEIEHFLGSSVFLDLSVHLAPGWTEVRGALHRFGYTSSSARSGTSEGGEEGEGT